MQRLAGGGGSAEALQFAHADAIFGAFAERGPNITPMNVWGPVCECRKYPDRVARADMRPVLNQCIAFQPPLIREIDPQVVLEPIRSVMWIDTT